MEFFAAIGSAMGGAGGTAGAAGTAGASATSATAAGFSFAAPTTVGASSAIGAGSTVGATSSTFLGMTSAQLAALTAGTSALGSIRQGQAVRADAKHQARLAGLAAEGQEVERRRRLVQALAHQSAAVGASGIEFSGSPRVSFDETIRQSGLDKLKISAGLSTQKQLLRVRGRNAVRGGQINAGATILDLMSDRANRGKA